MVAIAGGIIFHPKRGIVLVNQNNNSWSLPKGHVEKGESLLDAAYREIYEETGIPSDALTLLGEIATYTRERIKRHADDVTEIRTITLFLFTTEYDSLAPRDAENPEARWVPIDEVEKLLTHPKDKEVFASVKEKIKLM